ncbi:hypothetical protein ABIA30_004779 [Mycobacterium sp. MAA66]|uniref:LpqN/LpqT family lipoprotein n=1 Tax=Mycobacterium sp. MAA66 TaxID=3156297 RepID=UPI003519B0BD
MFENARSWRLLAGGVAAAVAGVVGFTGSTASADPLLPPQPIPAPATVTQTVTVQAAAPYAPPVATPAFVPAGQPLGAPLGQPAALPQPAAPIAAPAPAAAPIAPTITPATAGTVIDFLKAHNVALQPQTAQGFTALNIVLPMPTGWSTVANPNVPDAFAVTADRVGGDGLYTNNAQLVVYKLVGGNFDPHEAISHGFIDSQQRAAWNSTDGSMADFDGMPSSIIEGTYRENNMTLNTSSRHLIATSGTDHYLVSLSVTTSAQSSVASGGATDAIINGFRVSAPGAPAPAPPAAPAPAPAAPVHAASPAAAVPAALAAPLPGLGR